MDGKKNFMLGLGNLSSGKNPAESYEPACVTNREHGGCSGRSYGWWLFLAGLRVTGFNSWWVSWVWSIVGLFAPLVAFNPTQARGSYSYVALTC